MLRAARAILAFLWFCGVPLIFFAALGARRRQTFSMIDFPFLRCSKAALVLSAMAFCLPLSVQAAPAAFVAQSAPDSFAPVPAPTVQALLSQVQTNPQVRSRYARYFHIPETHLLAYLRANLVASRLSDDGRYTMFCVRPNGLVYPAVLHMPKGSRVFALRGGPAVLSCPDGNPLARFQTAVETRIVPLPAAVPAAAETATPRRIITPTQGREIVVPTYVPTPVYQAVSPLTPAERAGEAQTPSSPAPSTASP